MLEQHSQAGAVGPAVVRHHSQVRRRRAPHSIDEGLGDAGEAEAPDCQAGAVTDVGDRRRRAGHELVNSIGDHRDQSITIGRIPQHSSPEPARPAPSTSRPHREVILEISVRLGIEGVRCAGPEQCWSACPSASGHVEGSTVPGGTMPGASGPASSQTPFLSGSQFGSSWQCPGSTSGGSSPYTAICDAITSIVGWSWFQTWASATSSFTEKPLPARSMAISAFAGAPFHEPSRTKTSRVPSGSAKRLDLPDDRQPGEVGALSDELDHAGVGVRLECVVCVAERDVGRALHVADVGSLCRGGELPRSVTGHQRREISGSDLLPTPQIQIGFEATANGLATPAPPAAGCSTTDVHRPMGSGRDMAADAAATAPPQADMSTGTAQRRTSRGARRLQFIRVSLGGGVGHGGAS